MDTSSAYILSLYYLEESNTYEWLKLRDRYVAELQAMGLTNFDYFATQNEFTKLHKALLRDGCLELINESPETYKITPLGLNELDTNIEESTKAIDNSPTTADFIKKLTGIDIAYDRLRDGNIGYNLPQMPKRSPIKKVMIAGRKTIKGILYSEHFILFFIALLAGVIILVLTIYAHKHALI